jgi:glutathione S-transferase
MITIHHLLVSQSERPIWLMEELGLPYELKSYPRQSTGLADPIFSKLHLLGGAPVIEDEGGVVMAESLAIFRYILDLYGTGKLAIAPGKPGYADFTYWFHYSNGGLMPMVLQSSFAKRLGGDPNSPAMQMLNERLGRHLGMIDKRLSATAYLAGAEFTAADILCHFPFGTLKQFVNVDISDRPHIRAWLRRLSERPAYQRAMKLAGHTTDPAASNH